MRHLLSFLCVSGLFLFACHGADEPGMGHSGGSGGYGVGGTAGSGNGGSSGAGTGGTAGGGPGGTAGQPAVSIPLAFVTADRQASTIAVHVARADGSVAELARAPASDVPEFFDYLNRHGVWWGVPWTSVSPNSAWMVWYDGANLRVLDTRTGASSPLPEIGAVSDKVLWSPDGTRFAYQKPSLDTKTYVAWPATGRIATLVDRSGTFGGRLEWSPDGSRLVYELYPPTFNGSGTGTELHTVKPDGTDDHLIDEAFVGGCDFSWSADSHRIAYLGAPGLKPGESLRDDATVQIRSTLPDGSDPKVLAELPAGQYLESQLYSHTETGTCRWSPHGDWIVAGVPGAVYSMHGDGTSRERLAAATALAATFSADGTRIAVTVNDGTTVTSTTMRVDGTDAHARVTIPSFNANTILWFWANAGVHAVYTEQIIEPGCGVAPECSTGTYTQHWLDDATGADLTLGDSAYSESFSPGGKRFGYATRSGYFARLLDAVNVDPVALPTGALAWFDDDHVSVVDTNSRNIDVVSMDGSPARAIWHPSADTYLVGLFAASRISREFAPLR